MTATHHRKPIPVAAVQWTEPAPPPGVCHCLALRAGGQAAPHVHTAIGPGLAEPGDWIVSGLDGVILDAFSAEEFAARFDTGAAPARGHEAALEEARIRHEPKAKR
jgi:hypothetical protein